MRGDKLYRGIGDADEKYIKSAEKAFKDGATREKRVKAGRIFKRIVSVAAAVVIIGGVWVVSFIVAQKRQEPDHPASTGEPVTDDSETSIQNAPDEEQSQTDPFSSADTNDEPSTEADTTFILNPSDTEPVNVDPESECGKMIQSFDEYLKAKERGKYGDYYVSYCVKVNGAYIGFIDDGDTAYTEALENEVIDGLPFCYGNGQKLTVINGGEYRYGLEAAFSDGIINSDILDQFFVRYSSDHKLYKEFESEYLRQSCEEFLGGENERNIKEKPEKDKELSLYNYIRIPYCKMLGDYKYAVLYLLWHQPAEECTDEYYTVSVGGYDFPVRTGLRFHIYDQGDVYPLDRAQLTAEELKALYDSYTKYEEPKTLDTTDTQFIDVEFEWLDFTNTDRITDAEKAKELSGVFDEYLRGEPNPGIDFCVKLGNGKYAALLNRHIAQICIESTENVGGYPIHYSNYRKMTVLSGDTAYFGLQNAYERDVLTDNDAYKIYTAYHNAFSDMYTDDIITHSEQYRNMRYAIDLYYNNDRNENEYNGYNVYYAKAVGNTYFAFIDDGTVFYTDDVTMKGTAGYMFTYYSGQRFTVLKDGQTVYGIDEAYENGLISEEEIGELFRDYYDNTQAGSDDFSKNYALKTSFEEYLDGASERDATNRPENAENITFYNQVKILFCMKLGDGRYASIFDMYGDTIDKTERSVTETAQGFEFFYNFGHVLRVLDDNGLTSLSGSNLSKDEVSEVLYAYITFYESFYDKVTKIKVLFDSFIQTGTSWENNVHYAYKTSDGVYIGIMAYGDLMYWEETVAGYTFGHPNGNKFLVIKDGILTEGLTEAYEQGIISAETVKEFYTNLQKFYEKQNENIEHSGYETTVKLIRSYWDGYGVSYKMVSTCDLAYSIIDTLEALNKTGKTVDKISDDIIDENTGYLPEGVSPGTLWLEVGSKIYRLSPDLSEIALVETHLGKGYALEMTDGLKKLLTDAWYYFPYDTYTGTYDNESKTLDMSHTYAADSTIEIKIKELNVEKKIDPENSVTLEVISSLDQYVPISLNCYQSDDNLSGGDFREIQLKAGETKVITLNFGGWKDYPFWVDITADNTRISLNIKP